MDNKSILITSAEANAGKSTVCANLASALSKTEAKILLVDADMRKARQHKVFRVANTVGLSTLLANRGQSEEAIALAVRNVGPNLDLLPAGPTPPNPAELLGSAQMRELHSLLLQNYDYVVIDSPPAGFIADALILSDIVGGIILIARHKQTKYESFGRVIQIFKEREANILGAVVTDVFWKNKMTGKYYKRKGSINNQNYDYHYYY